MVVFFQARGWRLRRPAARISRQTRLRETRIPRVTSSAKTPAHPGMPVQLGVDLTDHVGELGVSAFTLAWPVGAHPLA